MPELGKPALQLGLGRRKLCCNLPPQRLHDRRLLRRGRMLPTAPCRCSRMGRQRLVPRRNGLGGDCHNLHRIGAERCVNPAGRVAAQLREMADQLDQVITCRAAAVFSAELPRALQPVDEVITGAGVGGLVPSGGIGGGGGEARLPVTPTVAVLAAPARSSSARQTGSAKG